MYYHLLVVNADVVYDYAVGSTVKIAVNCLYHERCIISAQ
jgi:hypothetical protein